MANTLSLYHLTLYPPSNCEWSYVKSQYALLGESWINCRERHISEEHNRISAIQIYLNHIFLSHRFEFLGLFGVAVGLRHLQVLLQTRLSHGVVDGVFAEFLLLFHHLRDRVVVKLKS